MKDIVLNNTGPKYSEMIIKIREIFDDELPKELTITDTFQVTTDAWNLANNKVELVERKLYKKELKAHKHSEVVSKMVDYKLKHFPQHKNIIVDFEIEDNIFRVKTQTPEEHFKSILNSIISYKK